MSGKRGAKWATAEQIARVRQLRQRGHTFEEIREETGMGFSSIHRYCNDIVLPKSKTAISKSLRADRRDRRETQAEDFARNRTEMWQSDSERPDYNPDRLPADAEGFDVSGIFPDRRLVDQAMRVHQRWIDEKAAGTIFYGVPVEVLKAHSLIISDVHPWDETWWRENRNRWEAARKLAAVNTTDMAERTGISASSISRYENGKRTPVKADMEKIRVATWAALERRLYMLDMAIATHDYTIAHGIDPEDSEALYDTDDALRWISGAGDEGEDSQAELTLDHLPNLVHLRSLQPVPLYRDESEVFMGYLGFAEPPIDIEEEEAGAA